MPEWGMLPIPQKLLRQGIRDMVRISDARMSGTSYGTCVLARIARKLHRRPVSPGPGRRRHYPRYSQSKTRYLGTRARTSSSPRTMDTPHPAIQPRLSSPLPRTSHPSSSRLRLRFPSPRHFPPRARHLLTVGQVPDLPSENLLHLRQHRVFTHITPQKRRVFYRQGVQVLCQRRTGPARRGIHVTAAIGPACVGCPSVRDRCLAVAA